MKTQHISITELGQYNGVQENNFIYSDNYNKPINSFTEENAELLRDGSSNSYCYATDRKHMSLLDIQCLNFGTERKQIITANSCINSV
jgi:hypothetical protein